MTARLRPITRTIAAVVATLFGVLTIASGGRALFGGADMGSVVPFVLWFNFAVGFVYVAAGIGLWRGVSWAPALAAGIAIATGLVFLVLLWHVWAGGAYETRTVMAMLLRLGVWTAIAIVAFRMVETG